MPTTSPEQTPYAKFGRTGPEPAGLRDCADPDAHVFSGLYAVVFVSPVDEFAHPAGLHRLHCAMCLLATAMMLRRRRTQAEAPGLAGVTWLVSLNHRGSAG